MIRRWDATIAVLDVLPENAVEDDTCNVILCKRLRLWS
jgi:hypothetical protein